MAEIISEQTEEYLQRFTSPAGDMLQQLFRETHAAHPHAHLMSSAVQGKFLEMISRMLRPLKVLEIGTFTGFSALCLAAGMAAHGMLHTIELRPDVAAIAQKNFNGSDFADRIILHAGAACDIIPLLEHKWDLVFIDADKTAYIDYYELTLPRLNPDGIIIVDNVLFHGQVLGEKISGKNALAIHAFNAHVAADDRTEQVMLSIRDGISLIRKIR